MVLRLRGGGKRGRTESDRVPLNEIGVKDGDSPMVKSCFGLAIDLNTTLDNMTNDKLQEYKLRIEGARAIEQVAAITLDYIPEYIAVQDSSNIHRFAISEMASSHFRNGK
jgi:hypothetical protein